MAARADETSAESGVRSRRTFGRIIRWVLAGMCVAVLAAGAGVLYLRSRDSATPVSVADALQRFRGSELSPPSIVSSADSPTSAGSELRLPALGVYLYATSGSERVDALGGAKHTYPAETTVTVSHTDCGVATRWDALHERWDEQRGCLSPAGEVLQSITSHHEFFGRADTHHYACDDGLVRPVAGADVAGTTWTTHCSDSSSSTVIHSTVVAVEVIEVNGAPVETIHIRANNTARGSVRVTATYDSWFSHADGLLLRRVAIVDSDLDSQLGTVHYHEQYEIRLRSLQPRT